ncbi:hypothetical protein P7C73_g4609, partial [Tremellales sp. Uapishka_1]
MLRNVVRETTGRKMDSKLALNITRWINRRLGPEQGVVMEPPKGTWLTLEDYIALAESIVRPEVRFVSIRARWQTLALPSLLMLLSFPAGTLIPSNWYENRSVFSWSMIKIRILISPDHATPNAITILITTPPAPFISGIKYDIAFNAQRANEAIFLSGTDTPWSLTRFNYMLQVASRHAGFANIVCSHMFRRSGAVVLKKMGTSDEKISRHLTHAWGTTT